MVESISLSEPKARKEYHCMACEAVCEGGIKYFLELLTFSEKKIVAAARRDNWKIKIGEVYHDEVNKCDGEIYHFRCKLEMYDLAVKYKWFPEDY